MRNPPCELREVQRERAEHVDHRRPLHQVDGARGILLLAAGEEPVPPAAHERGAAVTAATVAPTAVAAAFARHGFRLQVERLPSRTGSIKCPKSLNQPSSGGIRYSMSCSAGYLGRGTRPPIPTHMMTPKRPWSGFVVFVYRTPADVVATFGNNDGMVGRTERDVLGRVTYFWRDNVVIGCGHCAGQLARLKEALNDV